MLPGRVDVAIVGAGFGGLGLAIQMKRHGLEDFVVLERSGDVGGTWNSNTYPGAQCDIPSNLYSWSFALKPDWSRAYPERDEIHDYIRTASTTSTWAATSTCNTEMLDAEWRASAGASRPRRASSTRACWWPPRPAERATIPDLPGPRQLRRRQTSTPRTGTTTTT